jgi:hypothetical protein
MAKAGRPHRFGGAMSACNCTLVNWRARSAPKPTLRKDSSVVYWKVYRFWLTALCRIQTIRERPFRADRGLLTLRAVT